MPNTGRITWTYSSVQGVTAVLPHQSFMTSSKKSYKMGNITIEATILGPNEDGLESSCPRSLDELFQDAFSGNPVFEKAIKREMPFWGTPVYYCIFKKEVIQFWNDGLTDYCGNYNGLASDIAREIFNPIDNVQYCISAE